MTSAPAIARFALAASLATCAAAAAPDDEPGYRDTPFLPGGKWRVHDADRPKPATVVPGATVGAPPSDAVILFDGTSLAAWHGQRRPWPITDGVISVPPRPAPDQDNALITNQSFGDVQLHLEYRMPNPPVGNSQDRGNSGIWFMQRYEVQILDGRDNPTYADGTVGAIYAWKPPLVNAARAPGEWQNYDIVFERPRFAADGHLLRPAYVTVLLNGILVQNRQPFLGSTVWRKVASYTPHPDAAPIQLQDHGSPVSFRNIWARPLPETAQSHDFDGVVK